MRADRSMHGCPCISPLSPLYLPYISRISQVRADRSMHGCHLLRNEMIHFVYNLQYYLMFEVLECSWQTLA